MDGENVKTILTLSDGTIFAIIGISLCIFGRNNENDRWEPISSIGSIANEEGCIWSPTTAIKLSEDRILIGGSDGSLCIYGKQQNKNWGIIERISGVVDDCGDPGIIYTLCRLSDDDALIGGNRLLYRYSLDKDTKEWNLTNAFSSFFEDNSYPQIQSITKAPNGNIFITDGIGRNDIYEYKEVNNKKFDYISCCNDIEKNEELGARKEYLTSVIPIHNNNIIAITKKRYEMGSLYECKKNSTGEWEIIKRIDNLKTDSLGNNRIKEVKYSPEGNIIIAWEEGEIKEYNSPTASVDNLKRRLDEFIAKGEN